MTRGLGNGPVGFGLFEAEDENEDIPQHKYWYPPTVSINKITEENSSGKIEKYYIVKLEVIYGGIPLREHISPKHRYLPFEATYNPSSDRLKTQKEIEDFIIDNMNFITRNKERRGSGFNVIRTGQVLKKTIITKRNISPNEFPNLETNLEKLLAQEI